jgi:HlyD family secretion protein
MMKKITIGIVVAVLVIAGASAAFLRGSGPAPAATTPTIAPTTEEALVAEAKTVPVHSVALSLPSGGIVAEVLVAEGDQVRAGQPLLRLDQTRAAATVAQAEAQLQQAQAGLAKLRSGATPQEIAAAEAQQHAAEAQLREVGGSVTSSDVAAAQAQLQQAQARLAELRAGPKSADMQAATAALTEAQAKLTTQRDQLSADKTNAQIQIDRAAAELTQAQSSYSTALQNWQYAQDTGRDPITPWLGADSKTGKKIPNTLSDAQRQQYYDAYVQAEAAMHNAERGVQQAQLAYDTARQAEISGIQAAEQQVASSQANLDKLRTTTDADIIAARAQVASSQASLNKLRGDQRGGALDAAQAAVDQAQANLDKLRAGIPESDLAVAAAEVRSAEAALKLAQVAVSESELRAPFAGTVAALDAQTGEYIAAGTPTIQLADLSAWQIETTDLTELNVAQVREGGQATVTFDAIPGLELPGTISHIRALGENKQGDITYLVTIKLGRQDPRLRWNMTASAALAR